MRTILMSIWNIREFKECDSLETLKVNRAVVIFKRSTTNPGINSAAKKTKFRHIALNVKKQQVTDKYKHPILGHKCMSWWRCYNSKKLNRRSMNFNDYFEEKTYLGIGNVARICC